MRAQLTITLPPELGKYVEELSEELSVTRSAVVSQALELDRQRRKELLMREGYEEVAEEHLELAREFDHADESASWPNY